MDSVTKPSAVLTADLLERMHEYWQAANYLSVGQIYLLDNPLLKRPLELCDVKPRLLGHWGTTPGLNFIYVHLNRVIQLHNLSMIFVAGPGHGGPGLVANAYLEGTYTEVYPEITRDVPGLGKLFKQFSFPGGIPSHVAPETPGSIHEGGELGYSLSHAFGAVFDNPGLIVACVVGDGEAETGPLATSWHSNKFLNPLCDGAVLPILHMNGYKIAGPTVLARIPRDELTALFTGYGYEPFYIEGSEPLAMHALMARTIDKVIERINQIQNDARAHGVSGRPRWPMIILVSPKGWTGPEFVDGKRNEGTFRAHQVPIANVTGEGHLGSLEHWMKTYSPELLFDIDGRLRADLQALCPVGSARMSANAIANGGALLRDLKLPDIEDFALDIPVAGGVKAEATRVQGQYIRDVVKLNPRNFRIFSPDETSSNRWNAVFEVTTRCSTAIIDDSDESVGPEGRVMEMLSEHQCEGWLEGYLLTGRHGIFSCYEAFIHIVDSMFNQHAKWLKACHEIPWRAPIASLNYLLSSHVWRQDHNGSSHQDPGFIDHVLNKKAGIVRVYLPPDANTLLAVTEHCLQTRNRINVIIAGKHSEAQWLDFPAAKQHCEQGAGVWEWASNDLDDNAEVVMACAGDVPTLEVLAAVKLLWECFPGLPIRMVNVVDLMTLSPLGTHPHGLSDAVFDSLFSIDKPVIFAYHGYPSLIHRLTYKRKNHQRFHVHGFMEEGTTTTPFDMVVLNKTDRYRLALAAVNCIPSLTNYLVDFGTFVDAKIAMHRDYIRENGIDLPEILDWSWSKSSNVDDLWTRSSEFSNHATSTVDYREM